MNTLPVEIQLKNMGRAVRFGFIAIVLGISYPNVRLALLLPRFESIYRDMLGSKPLPAITGFVIHFQPLLIGISFAIPLLALALLCFASLSRSLWSAGAVIVAVFLQLHFTCTAVTTPLVTIITGMGGTTP